MKQRPDLRLRITTECIQYFIRESLMVTKLLYISVTDVLNPFHSPLTNSYQNRIKEKEAFYINLQTMHKAYLSTYLIKK